MKTLILDLRTISFDGGDEWADSPARYAITNALLEYAGRIIKVKITKINPREYDEDG